MWCHTLRAMPMFCRHNRLTVNCPICSLELGPELGGKPAPARRSSAPASSRSRGGTTTPRRGVVTKRLARAADDGYRNPLVPGLRATADAERLGRALAWADARLAPPGPHPAVAEEPVQEEAFWLAFLLALVPPDAHELHEVLRAVVRRFDLRPDRPSGERMRRRGVTLAPSRGGRVVPLAFSLSP